MKRLKTGYRVGILSVILCLSLASFSFIKQKQQQDNGTIYEFVIPKKGTMIDNATCYAWIPPDVGTIRSVIVHTSRLHTGRRCTANDVRRSMAGTGTQMAFGFAGA
ncbi:MAG TPA: hypothetical protein VGN20_13825 [Mucilaginibacter sp.]|jgi:hypothetical protein